MNRDRIRTLLRRLLASPALAGIAMGLGRWTLIVVRVGDDDDSA